MRACLWRSALRCAHAPGLKYSGSVSSWTPSLLTLCADQACFELEILLLKASQVGGILGHDAWPGRCAEFYLVGSFCLIVLFNAIHCTVSVKNNTSVMGHNSDSSNRRHGQEDGGLEISLDDRGRPCFQKPQTNISSWGCSLAGY